MFISCKVIGGSLLNGKNPDENQKEPEWIKLDEIEKYTFFPKELAGKLKKAEDSNLDILHADYLLENAEFFLLR